MDIKYGDQKSINQKLKKMKRLVLLSLFFLIVASFVFAHKGLYKKSEIIYKFSDRDSISTEQIKVPLENHQIYYTQKAIVKNSEKSKVKNFKHPELQTGEIFLTNISSKYYWNRELGLYERSPKSLKINFKEIGYKSKRLGKNAYNQNGNLIRGQRPVFVKKKEYDKQKEKQIK